MPAYGNFNMIEGNWGNLYFGYPEELPNSFPPPMGKSVLISRIVDANLMVDLNTGRYQTGISHTQKKPIEWYYKLKYCVKTSTYVSEYAAARICTDQIADLCNTLRYLGVPLYMINISYASFMFGDNFSVVNLNVMPARKLQYRSHILNYQHT